jgi:hypothetical protein
MREPLFMIELELETDGCRVLEFDSFPQCWNDRVLRDWFDRGQVATCVVRHGDQKITGLPRALMSFDRLIDHLISNSSTILRLGYQHEQ